MTPQSTKVRLVRCPNCRQVLPELPDILLYRCGGCNTILQAKNWKMATNHGELASQTTCSAAEIARDHVSEEETGSSNHSLNDPPREESSRDKENIEYRDELVGSSSELSELRSVSNELSCSAEANYCENEDLPVEESLNQEKNVCSFGQFSKLHDSDGDSTGCSNFSGEFPSSSELIYHEAIELVPAASKHAEEVVNGCLDQSTEEELYNVGGSLSVPQEGDNLQHEVRDFSMYKGQENGNPPAVSKHVPLEGAARANHDLTSLPKEELPSDKDNVRYEDENVKSSRDLSADSGASTDDLSSLPEVNCFENGYSPGEESSNHGSDKLSLEHNSVSIIHDSNGELTGVQTFTGEFPSSSDFVYHETKELIPHASERMENFENTLDQPTIADQLPPADPRNGEQMESNYVNLDGVSEARATTSNHDLISPPKEELSLDKDGEIHHDENLECSMKVVEDKSVSSYGLSDSCVVNCFENVYSPVEESLNDDRRNCSTGQKTHSYDSELHDLNPESTGVRKLSSSEIVCLENEALNAEARELVEEDVKVYSDQFTKVGHTDDGKSLGVLAEAENFLDNVRSISEHENRENELPPTVTEHRGLNGTNVYVENDDVAEEESKMSGNDLSIPFPPEDESLLNKSNRRHQDEHMEAITELSKDGSVSNDLHDSNGDSTKDINFYAELPHSNEFVHHKINELRSDTNERVEYFDPCTEIEQSEGEKSLAFFQEDDKFLHETRNSSDHEDLNNRLPPVDGEHREESKNDFINLENDKKSGDQCADQNESFGEGITLAGVPSSSEIVSHQNGSALQFSEPSVKVNQTLEATPTFKRLDSEKYMDPSDGDTNDASQKVLMGRDVLANITPADEEYTDYSRRRATRNFGSASSMEFWGSSAIADTRHQLSDKHGRLTDSSTSRGHYAYDGSESSDDGADNQIHPHVAHFSRRKGKDVNNISTLSTLKKDGFRVKNTEYIESDMNLQAPRSSSVLLENKHHAIRGSHWEQNEFTDTRRHTRGSEYMMPFSQVASSQLPFSSRDLPANHKSQSPSIYRHFLPPSHPNSHSHDKPLYSEPNKMNLLRTVCELKDQLNSIRLPKISKSGGFHSGGTEEISAPLYFDHLTSEMERYGGLNHLEYDSRYYHEQGWDEQSNVSRLALPREAANYRHQVNCSCSHCRTQNWRYSAPLPPQYSHYKNNRTAPQTGYNRINVSSSSTLQHYAPSKFSVRASDTELDHQRYRDNEMKRLYLMDKYHTSKKLLRPMAGGSPFVSCYHCSELLQLPADFLLFKKRYHKLRCIACSKVLKFLLVEGMHIIPYLRDHLPLSETGNFSDSTNQRNQVTMPHSNSWQNGEPVSCSDDYGLSFHRSYSTEGEASAIMPSSGIMERNRHIIKMTSITSFETTKDRKLISILKESTKNEKISIETSEPGTSSGLPKFINVPSEIEELPPSANSPLHQLMGYTSPSEVMNK